MSEIFKNLTELEEFFHNLGIEYRFSCYSEKNAEGCHLLGDYMSKIENDLIRSSKVFKDNCDINGFARSCTQFGANLVEGRGCDRDVKTAVDYFNRGCDLGDNEGCFYSGQLLSGADPQYESFIKPDITKSVDQLVKGCQSTKNESVSAECCYYLHSFYLFGKNGCKKDLSKALTFGIRACDLDNMESCNNLSQMYALGMGTDKNEELAQKYRIKSIDMLEQLRKQQHIDTQRT